jgi:putative flippase GtrA
MLRVDVRRWQRRRWPPARERGSSISAIWVAVAGTGGGSRTFAQTNIHLPDSGHGLAGIVERLEQNGIFRIAKFAIAAGVGFLVAEGILVLGVFIFYHTTSVPSLAFSSPSLLGLDALAFGVGVTVAFVINERVTVKGQGEEVRKRGAVNWLVRWGKYELANLLGNVLIVVVQLVLLATVSLSPVFGSIVGAILSYPVTYLVSMRFVWRVHPLRQPDAPDSQRLDPPQGDSSPASRAPRPD